MKKIGAFQFSCTNFVQPCCPGAGTRSVGWGIPKVGLVFGFALGRPILGTGQGLLTGGFPGSGSQKEELETHGKRISDEFRAC